MKFASSLSCIVSRFPLFYSFDCYLEFKCSQLCDVYVCVCVCVRTTKCIWIWKNSYNKCIGFSSNRIFKDFPKISVQIHICTGTLIIMQIPVQTSIPPPHPHLIYIYIIRRCALCRVDLHTKTFKLRTRPKYAA